MEYLLYKLVSVRLQEQKNEYKVLEFSPRPWRLKLKCEKIGFKGALVRLLFFLQSYGKAKIFYVLSDKNEVVHTSYLVPKCGKFSFLKKGNCQ